MIDPVATSIPWFKPVDGERVVAFFNPLYDMEGGKGVQVKMEGIQELLTKEVEDMSTEEEAEEFGNDPILIYQGDMWLGGKFLNVIFRQSCLVRRNIVSALCKIRWNRESRANRQNREH